MRIQHNIMAMNAYRNYTNNASALSKNLEKLSSGYRINRAGDDAAGLAISEKMRAQITGLDAAGKNVKDGISLVKTAEGALQEVHDMLGRMKYLATQSANGTYDNPVDRANLQKEVNSLKDEINRIADSANFNGQKLLDGSLSGGAISASKASMIGKDVSSFTAASLEVTLKADLQAIDPDSKDIFIIDGQKLEIDYSTGVGKEIKALLDKDLSTATTDDFKALAKNLTEKFNQAIKEQGLTGEVEIVASDAANGKLTLKSKNTGANSEFSFAGVTKGGTIGQSVGAHLFAGGTPATTAILNKATQDYAGAPVKATDTFQMDINGTKVIVTVGAALDNAKTGAGGTATTMTAAATALESAIQNAVDAYNTANGLTAGQLDKATGLTGLVSTDFTVTADKSGGFKIEYTGDQDVNFSFSDIGKNDVADRLGLASGSSKQGGAGGLNLQIGDTSDQYNQMNVSVGDMHTLALGIKDLDIGTQEGAHAAIDKIMNAINTVSSTRGDLGAIQNRLEHTQNNLSVMKENIQDAESSIRDTDVADEMMRYTKNNILLQSAQAMLAQANQVPQGVLQLLQ